MSTRAKTRKNSRRRGYRLKALAATALTGPMAAAGLAVGSQAPARAASSAPAPSTQPGTPVKATPIAAPGGPAGAQAAALAPELCWTTGVRKFYKTDIFGFRLYSIGSRTDWCAKNGNFSRFLYHNNTNGTEILDIAWHFSLWPPAQYSGRGWYNDEYRAQWLYNPAVQYCGHIWGLFYGNGTFTMDINTGVHC